MTHFELLRSDPEVSRYGETVGRNRTRQAYSATPVLGAVRRMTPRSAFRVILLILQLQRTSFHFTVLQLRFVVRLFSPETSSASEYC